MISSVVGANFGGSSELGNEHHEGRVEHSAIGKILHQRGEWLIEFAQLFEVLL